MRPGRVLLSLLAVVAVACGDNPLESIGLRSSDWINEPTVPTTVPVVTTKPTVIPLTRLQWANDSIVTAASLDDVAAVLAEVFARREGDRFIQASRAEIAAVLPDVAFPGLAPAGAEWVSSQLVFENDGTIATDTSVAFGIWSAEPYTRSRSVAQMVVLRVATDLETATQVASGEIVATCALFADRATDNCEIITLEGREIWQLGQTAGPTLVWFEGPYRYELFGRSFVPLRVLQDMTTAMEPLATITAQAP